MNKKTTIKEMSKYLSIVVVKPQEFQKWLQAFFAMEKLSGKMAIEELNAISN
jgi:hypothetical protein